MGKEESWQEIGRTAAANNASTYKVQSFRRELHGRTYRFIVVRSTGLAAQKEHKLERVLEGEKDTLTKAIEKARKTVHNCEEDARAAGEALTHQHRKALYGLRVMVVAEEIQEKRQRRGRPRKDEPAPGPARNIVWQSTLYLRMSGCCKNGENAKRRLC